jgi:signal peptidase I
MLRGVGKHELRFANVDDRLTVWVDGSLPFGDGVEYSGVRKGEPDEVNDRQPASIGVHGNTGLTVSHLKLYRDTYYTGSVGGFFGNEPRVATRFIQPGHYLCLGDNSTQSSDGRDWGMVPERLMLGRALLVYFPVWPLGVNRAGPIR